MTTQEDKRAELRQAALEYHEFPTPGKISVTPTKQLMNQRDLALAYSPGVAAACEEIVADPANAFRYTARGNLVAVVTNGTAVLGLGNIGPLASKPVMEGKGVLLHRRAGAYLRRHQPGGHQGARLLLCRAQAARAHEDSRLP
jgi:malate dehydrogenase (oxaloacetate-decarboxylating)(NADP+)